MSADQNTTSNASRCPKCGTDLPTGVTPDRCPRCLLQAGLGSGSAPNPDVTATSAPDAVPPAASRLPLPGEVFGHYRIVRFLGKGGMGASYEAEDLQSGRRLALKILTAALDSNETRRRFLREGRLAASINHPNSVYVFATEEIGDTPVIAMELMTGGTLQDRAAAKGPLPVGEAVDVAVQIIAGLEAAQAIGILHRDIKPSNCFVDRDGTVKVGDYGLSVSSVARWDSIVTAAGAFLGTPAFCSPEQVRGDELTARSDLYAVGVTLYYLLTGHMPFQGKSLPQLLAAVLERKPDSPTLHRPDLPAGVCRIVLRCLEKRPDERFASYAELRQALLPYASAAPTPATLGRRCVAGIVDRLVLGAAAFPLSWVVFGGWQAVLSRGREGQEPQWQDVQLGLLGLLLAVSYYGVCEGLWGASAGKALCGLRVADAARNAPGLLRAGLRALIFEGVPSLPGYLAMLWLLQHGETLFGPNGEVTMRLLPILALGYSAWLILALLFSSARRRNGFAGWHDLASGTRVIERAAYYARPALPEAEQSQTPAESAARIGPYQVLETLRQTDAEEMLLGYDPVLLRKVWIRKLPTGSPPVAPSLCELTRPGRLRWLTGRRSDTECWDAYEAPAGNAFLNVIAARQDWTRVRFWLLDLAGELRAATKDGTLPAVLTLDRLWITADGRAKLLDFVTPGVSCPATPDPAVDASADPAHARFLHQVAVAALEGQPVTVPQAQVANAAVPLPLHAREFLHALPDATSLELPIHQLQGLLGRRATVTRLHRLALVGGCSVMPLVFCAFAAFGLAMVVYFGASDSTLPELSHGLDLLAALPENRWDVALTTTIGRGGSEAKPAGPKTKVSVRKNAPVCAPEKKEHLTEALEVYIAGRFKSTITDPASRKGIWGQVLISPANWQLAEAALLKHPIVSTQELAAAAKEVNREFGLPDVPEAEASASGPTGDTSEDASLAKLRSLLPAVLVVTFGAFSVLTVAIPALLGALLFRGGALLHLLGLAVVRRDGSRASRWQVFCRAMVVWTPWVLLYIAGFQATRTLSPNWAAVLMLAVLMALVTASLLLPGRGLADRIARTWLVPK
ncbi:MAG: hypothetical protein A3K19_28460 [Lentisphaerae bacterium RIFOXYB12_FULL_65_16]|nr:MAG: hypothetical protein A3K18_19710 [Lentisphaerae bacterium RIFOXYA12_64_32]OGV85519.1 MAG: hypothetical protein A3K19_28460 [Lentisphaerae bacterium RIFOXYB12_FULL_65_16]